jgi:hypothetical protein
MKIKTIVLVLILLAMSLTGCEVLQEIEPTAVPFTPAPVVVGSVTETAAPTLTATAPPATAPSATAVSRPTAVPTDPPTAAPTETATPAMPVSDDLRLEADSVYIYPVPQLYAGDLATFQVIANVPNHIAPNAVDVHIYVGDSRLVDATLNWRNLGGDVVGLYTWIWDTTAQAGDHTVTILLDPDDKIQIGDENPDNNQVTFSLTVAPVTLLSSLEREQQWLTVNNICCNVHVVTHTAAHRDIEYLAELVDDAFSQASIRLEEAPQRRFDVFFIDRVIGQGGYAGGSMVISYLDRDYAGTSLYEVLLHEAVHLIDRQFAPKRINFLAEGVAVWAAGGHYKPEDIDGRTAALLQADLYIPIDHEFINDFYNIQHEIGYLQAASFVNYLINNYGWTAVRAFYTDVTPESAPTLGEAVDSNLQRHFGKTLAQTEKEWLDHLRRQRPDRSTLADLQTTIRFYEVMRYYQRVHDPTAYFLTAWLPPAEEAQQRGLTADLTRKPRAEINIILETILHSARASLLDGEYNRANVLLDSVVRVLDNGGAIMDPLASHYQRIIQVTGARGYEAKQIEISGTEATVMARPAGKVTLVQLNLTLNNQSWILSR